MNTDIVWHKHHIVPRHAGGTDDKSNLIKVNIPMHAMLHKIRYEEVGDEYDLIAHKFLSGQIKNAEATRQAQSVNGKIRAAKLKEEGFYSSERQSARATAWNYSEAGQINAKRSAKIAHKASLTSPNHNSLKISECPHCGKVGKSMPMKRWHFDNCRVAFPEEHKENAEKQAAVMRGSNRTMGKRG